MTENPYRSPTPNTGRPNEEQPLSEVASSSKPLWTAYIFAPAVAPLTFIVLLFIAGAAFTAFGVEVNPASFIILPIIAVTFGMAVCYLVAGVIGMPIAFYLRKRNALTGYTIHGAALAWVAFVAVVAGSPVALSQQATAAEVLLGIAVLACIIAPSVLLSATCFWLIVKKRGGLSTTVAE